MRVNSSLNNNPYSSTKEVEREYSSDTSIKKRESLSDNSTPRNVGRDNSTSQKSSKEPGPITVTTGSDGNQRVLDTTSVRDKENTGSGFNFGGRTISQGISPSLKEPGPITVATDSDGNQKPIEPDSIIPANIRALISKNLSSPLAESKSSHATDSGRLFSQEPGPITVSTGPDGEQTASSLPYKADTKLEGNLKSNPYPQEPGPITVSTGPDGNQIPIDPSSIPAAVDPHALYVGQFEGSAEGTILRESTSLARALQNIMKDPSQISDSLRDSLIKQGHSLDIKTQKAFGSSASTLMSSSLGIAKETESFSDTKGSFSSRAFNGLDGIGKFSNVVIKTLDTVDKLNNPNISKTDKYLAVAGVGGAWAKASLWAAKGILSEPAVAEKFNNYLNRSYTGHLAGMGELAENTTKLTGFKSSYLNEAIKAKATSSNQSVTKTAAEEMESFSSPKIGRFNTGLGIASAGLATINGALSAKGDYDSLTSKTSSPLDKLSAGVNLATYAVDAATLGFTVAEAAGIGGKIVSTAAAGAGTAGTLIAIPAMILATTALIKNESKSQTEAGLVRNMQFDYYNSSLAVNSLLEKTKKIDNEINGKYGDNPPRVVITNNNTADFFQMMASRNGDKTASGQYLMNEKNPVGRSNILEKYSDVVIRSNMSEGNLMAYDPKSTVETVPRLFQNNGQEHILEDQNGPYGNKVNMEDRLFGTGYASAGEDRFERFYQIRNFNFGFNGVTKIHKPDDPKSASLTMSAGSAYVSKAVNPEGNWDLMHISDLAVANKPAFPQMTKPEIVRTPGEVASEAMGLGGNFIKKDKMEVYEKK